MVLRATVLEGGCPAQQRAALHPLRLGGYLVPRASFRALKGFCSSPAPHTAGTRASESWEELHCPRLPPALLPARQREGQKGEGLTQAARAGQGMLKGIVRWGGSEQLFGAWGKADGAYAGRCWVEVLPVAHPAYSVGAQ